MADEIEPECPGPAMKVISRVREYYWIKFG